MSITEIDGIIEVPYEAPPEPRKLSFSERVRGRTFAAQPQTQVNPRKVQTGTSYQAQGLAQAPRLDSEMGSSMPVRILELVPELVSPQQRQLVHARMQNDAGVDVSIRAVKTPELSADYFVEPYSSDPVDVEISDFCWDNLNGGLNNPWIHTLEDILGFFTEGYSVLEKVHEDREWTPHRKGGNAKNYTMLKKLAIRPVSTIKEIQYDDNGGPTAIVQNAIRTGGKVEEVTIDISKCVIFTHGRRGGDLTGKSLLRTAYPHWFYKTHLYKIDAIQKERHALGIPKGRLQPGYTQQDKNALRTMLRNLRSNEESYMMLPPGVDVEFAEVKSQLVDCLISASHHNVMILLNVMAQFLALGIEHGGSGGGGRATSGSQVDMFMKALHYIAGSICDVINMFVIPELVVFNYNTRNFPKLKVRNIGETRDLQMLGAALANLIHEGAITIDDPTEGWIRTVFGMPNLAGTRSTSSNIPVGGANGGIPQVAGDTSNSPTNAGNGNKNATGSNGGQGNVGKPPNAFA